MADTTFNIGYLLLIKAASSMEINKSVITAETGKRKQEALDNIVLSLQR